MMQPSNLSFGFGICSITSIRSALDDLDWLVNNKRFEVRHDTHKLSKLRNKLRNITVFILYARKRLRNDVHLSSKDDNIWNKDQSLKSFVASIEDGVRKTELEIHSYRLNSVDKFSSESSKEVSSFLDAIESFDEVIQKCYITLLDYSRDSSSQTLDELVEIIHSILECKEDVIYLHRSHEEVIQALLERLAFLKNFIRFSRVMGTNYPQLGKLLSHVEVVTFDACCLGLFTGSYFEWQEKIPSRISLLLQKFKPIDLQVYETYIQVLTSSKVWLNVYSPTTLVDVMKDFIDSLACELWDMVALELECRPVAFEKDQLQKLYEGLRFLRTVLKQQPNKFDHNIMDLTAIAIRDAGLVIFSLCHKGVEMDPGMLDLLGRINHITAQVGEKVPETSKHSFPKTNELGFVDDLLDSLMSLTHSFTSAIHDQLVILRSFLGEIVELRVENEELQILWDRVMEVAYKVEFHLVVVGGDIPGSLLSSFDSIMEDISIINLDSLKVLRKRQDIKVKKIVSRESNDTSSKSRAMMANEVVGFDAETRAIIDRLTRGSNQLRMVAVVGMPGLGKTTLATRVYNDPSIVAHFHVHAWYSVSQSFNKKTALLEILSYIVPGDYHEMAEDDLADKLRRHLKGRRYIICFDDVWDVEVWNSFQWWLPDDAKGSRIIMTSRRNDVAPQAMLNEGPIFLNHLTKDESWELLKTKLFCEKGWPPELNELGMKIAHGCKGLPLTITIVAGILENVDKESWEGVLESLNSGSISTAEPCMRSLELSYKHLPNYLKPCLLYLGAFLEDQEVLAKNLIRLWVAEGFIQKARSKSLEEVGMDFVNDLASRSLILLAKRRSMGGGVKACRMHDLLRDFCVAKAKQENFCHFLKGPGELLAFNEPCFARRLCIYSEPKHFKESKLFCPRVRTLLFFGEGDWYLYSLDISFINRVFKLLRVMDIRQIYLGHEFPEAILILAHLRFLAIKAWLKLIPSSVDKLSKLQTFILDSSLQVLLPATLWNMPRLRHLCMVSSYKSDGFVLHTENLDSSPDLNELDSFSGAIISVDIMEKQLRKFPNIRKLKCKLFLDWRRSEDFSKVVVPEFLSRLESLYLTEHKLPTKFVFELDLPANLKKLTLAHFGLPWSKISTVGKLPNLEVLKLLEKSFNGFTWEVEEGEFLKLRYLKLDHLNIVRWVASGDQFPCLEKLILQWCKSLVEVPTRLEEIPTLEVIEVNNSIYHNKRLSQVFARIQESQKEMGNGDLKLFIRST